MIFILLASELPKEAQQEFYGTVLDGESFDIQFVGRKRPSYEFPVSFPVRSLLAMRAQRPSLFKTSATPLKRGALRALFESHLAGTSCQSYQQ